MVSVSVKCDRKRKADAMRSIKKPVRRADGYRRTIMVATPEGDVGVGGAGPVQIEAGALLAFWVWWSREEPCCQRDPRVKSKVNNARCGSRDALSPQHACHDIVHVMNGKIRSKWA